MGFVPTCFDNNVWIKERRDGSGYDHMSTHVDDVLCVAKDPKCHMVKLAENVICVTWVHLSTAIEILAHRWMGTG